MKLHCVIQGVCYKQSMIWIVGKSFSEFRSYLSENYIEYGIFWDSALELPEKLKSVDCPTVYLELQDVATLPEQLSAHPHLVVDAVITAGYENYVLPAAHIAKHYGIPGPSPESAAAATDKALMRKKFMDFDPSITPHYAEITSWHDIVDFMTTHSFPVILKPASLMKSLLITKSSSMVELEENYKQTIAQVDRLYEKYGVGQHPKIIIEEFLNGSMHTVAGFANAQGDTLIIPSAVDCMTGYDAGYKDNFLYSRAIPTRLAEDIQNQVIAVAKKGIEALGLQSCPAHVEIMLTDQGPKIIEIGARIGGYRPRMYEYAYGIDLQEIMLDIAGGHNPAANPSAQRSIVVYELFPEAEGPFKELVGAKNLSNLPSLRHLSIKPDPGDIIGRSSQGYKAAAVIILGNDDVEQCRRDAEFVNSNVQVVLSS